MPIIRKGAQFFFLYRWALHLHGHRLDVYLVFQTDAKPHFLVTNKLIQKLMTETTNITCHDGLGLKLNPGLPVATMLTKGKVFWALWYKRLIMSLLSKVSVIVLVKIQKYFNIDDLRPVRIWCYSLFGDSVSHLEPTNTQQPSGYVPDMLHPWDVVCSVL